jgi:cell division protein FtsQ
MAQPVLSLPRKRQPVVYRLAPSGRSLIVGAAVAVAGVLAYVVARETPMFAVRTVVVQGAPPAVAQEASAALARFDGTNLLALNGAAVIRVLEDLPAIRSASYDRSFPHELRVRVVPEAPVAVIRRGPGAWLASSRGRIIRAVARTRFRHLPRVWLPASAPIDLGAFLDGDAAAAARALRTFVATRFAQRVIWARVRSGQLTLGLRSGLELRFGSTADLALKIAVARGVLPTLGGATGVGSYLDVSVPERPVAGNNPQPAG